MVIVDFDLEDEETVVVKQGSVSAGTRVKIVVIIFYPLLITSIVGRSRDFQAPGIVGCTY